MDNLIEWDKTDMGVARVQNSPFFVEGEKEKFFKGRPIIGRDKAINGGIYLGASAREAIVVDDQKDQQLNYAYNELIQLRKKAQEHGETFKQGVLLEAYNLVKRLIPFDLNNTDRIIGVSTKSDRKIALSVFFGGGVCRHQALLLAYFLERLLKEGYLKGKVSIDRNFVDGKGGHAWVRYTNSVGKVFILDPTQNYVGSLDDIERDDQKWFYERPEEQSSSMRIKNFVRDAFLGE